MPKYYSRRKNARQNRKLSFRNRMRGGATPDNEDPSILQQLGNKLGFTSPTNSSTPLSDTSTSFSSEKIKGIADSFQDFVNDIANNVADVIVAKTRALQSEQSTNAIVDEQPEIQNDDINEPPSPDNSITSPDNSLTPSDNSFAPSDNSITSPDDNTSNNGEGDFNSMSQSSTENPSSNEMPGPVDGSEMGPNGADESASQNEMSGSMDQSPSIEQSPSMSPIGINESASQNEMSNDMTQSASPNENQDTMAPDQNPPKIGGYSAKRNNKSKRRRVQPKRRTHKGRVSFRGL